MRRRLMSGGAVISLFVATGLAGMSGATSAATPGDQRVTNGNPGTPFPQNKQNEPGLALDPSSPKTLVAGSNDEIDLGPCRGSSCPFTPGVGVSGVYFSFDGGVAGLSPPTTVTATAPARRSGTGRSGRCPTTSKPAW